jgi:hypothetical protein
VWGAATYALSRTTTEGDDGIGHRDHRDHRTPMSPMLPMPDEIGADADPLGEDISDIPPQTEAVL